MATIRALGDMSLDLQIAGLNWARELGKATQLPIIAGATDDGSVVVIAETTSRELMVAVSEDDEDNWAVYFSVDDLEADVGHAGIVSRVEGIKDLAEWLMGGQLKRQYLKIGQPDVELNESLSLTTT